MIVVELGFTEASLEATREIIRSVGRNVRAVEIQRDAVVEVQVSLNRLEINHSQGPHIRRVFDIVFFHHLASTLNNAGNACLPDEHMVRFLRQHEAARARKRIEARFRQGAKLEFAVPVGKKRKHIERKPVRCGLVKRAENARIIGISGTAREQCFSFLTPVPAEIAVQQVDHSPQVTPFFHVHLKNVPQIVQGRTRHPQHLLLFDRSGFRIALRNDDSPQDRAIFTRDFLPGWLTLVNAEIHLALFVARLQENAPAVFRHFHIVKLRPAVGFHTDRCAQVHIIIVTLIRTHVVPPAHVRRLPMFERALKDTVSPQIDVVRNLLCVINHGDLLRRPGRGPSLKLFPS